MTKKQPHIEISPRDFYQLIIDKINTPGEIPKGDWLPPEIILDGYIVFNKMTIEDQLEFKNIQFERVRLCFLNCRLKGRYIFNSFNIRSITFLYTEVDVIQISDSSLDILDYKFSTGLALSIQKTNFRQFISLRESTIRNSIQINEVKSKGQIGITNIDSKNLLVTESVSNLNFYSGTYETVSFYNNTFTIAKLFSLNNKPLLVTNPLKIENDNPVFKYGTLEFGPDYNASTIIKGKNDSFFEIETLEIKDSLFSNISITIDHVKIHTLSISNLVNTAILNLININFNKPDSTFNIENSILGRTRLYNCDLSAHVKFKFKLSDIREVIYNNVEWPDNLSKENNDEKIELYRQLKHIASKNYDSINEVRFYSIEKNAFYKKLKWNWKDSGTKLIFLFNKVSNNNNLSWLKPIAWNLCIQFLIFILLGVAIKLHSNTPALNSIADYYLPPFFKFLYLLNPAFNSETIHPDIAKYNLTIGLVILSRIVSAYLIYQTIAAYRRYK